MKAVYTCKYFNRKTPKNASFWDPMEIVNKSLTEPVVGEVLLRVRVGGEAKFVDGMPGGPRQKQTMSTTKNLSTET